MLDWLRNGASIPADNDVPERRRAYASHVSEALPVTILTVVTMAVLTPFPGFFGPVGITSYSTTGCLATSAAAGFGYLLWVISEAVLPAFISSHLLPLLMHVFNSFE